MNALPERFRTPPPLRWERYCVPHPDREKRAWSPQRIAAARRKVQREKDAIPLFPELARYQTVEERVADMDGQDRGFRIQMREHRLKNWRDVRTQLRQLPPITKAGILFYWRVATLPNDPLYLLTLIHNAKKGHSPWRKLRQLRLYRLIGACQDPVQRAALVARLPQDV